MNELYELLKEGKLEEALVVSRKHLTQSDNNEVYEYFNHAMMAYELDRIGEAAWAMEEAREILPDCPIIHRVLGDFLLRLGKYKEGFIEKEWRFTMPLPDSPRPGIPIWGEILPRIRRKYKKPYWDGSDLTDKTILVFNEAGFGDMIQNIRYLRELKAKKVILEVKKDLYRLFRNSFSAYAEVIESDGTDSFVSTFITNRNYDSNLPEHDFVVSSESFHHFLDPELKKVQPLMKYLFPEEVECKAATKVMEYHKPRIGICWAGNDKEESDCLRTCHLKHFKKLDLSEVQLFSLQKGKLIRRWQEGDKIVNIDLLEGSEGINLVDLSKDLHDFNDTAEAIQEMDLVISVDTSVAHLAGALGKPVWLLKSKRDHEWRWAKKWYDSMTVIKQKELNDWDGLFDEVAEELKKLKNIKNVLQNLN